MVSGEWQRTPACGERMHVMSAVNAFPVNDRHYAADAAAFEQPPATSKLLKDTSKRHLLQPSVTCEAYVFNVRAVRMAKAARVAGGKDGKGGMGRAARAARAVRAIRALWQGGSYTAVVLGARV